MDPFPLYPPLEWFKPPATMPRGSKIGAITAGAEAGRVYGYVAPFDSCLLRSDDGNECLPPPKSPTNYVNALQGDTITASGEIIHTANIGGGVNHYEEGGFLKAVKHYDNTASQLMRVVYGEDDYGIWVAGALWPHVDELQVAKIRASALSGDWRWRPELQDYDMAGAQLVNNPGYPLMRFLAASAGERAPLVGGWGGVGSETFDDYETDFLVAAAPVLNAENRAKWAKSGVAMSDGSFPIPDKSWIKRAVARLGSAPADKRAAVKSHIMKRARALGATNLLPPDWTSRKASAMAKECTCGAHDPDPIFAALSTEQEDALVEKVMEKLKPSFDRLEEGITQALVQHA